MWGHSGLAANSLAAFIQAGVSPHFSVRKNDRLTSDLLSVSTLPPISNRPPPVSKHPRLLFSASRTQFDGVLESNDGQFTNTVNVCPFFCSTGARKRNRLRSPVTAAD